jgi:hypothetical protein
MTAPPQEIKTTFEDALDHIAAETAIWIRGAAERNEDGVSQTRAPGVDQR